MFLQSKMAFNIWLTKYIAFFSFAISLTFLSQISNANPFLDAKPCESLSKKGILNELKQFDCIQKKFEGQEPFTMVTNRFASQVVKQRAILSRLGVETASNSFRLGMQPSGVLTGGIWSVLHGHYLRDSQAAFSTEANDHGNCPRHGAIPSDGAQTHQHR